MDQDILVVSNPLRMAPLYQWIARHFAVPAVAAWVYLPEPGGFQLVLAFAPDALPPLSEDERAELHSEKELVFGRRMIFDFDPRSAPFTKRRLMGRIYRDAPREIAQMALGAVTVKDPSSGLIKALVSLNRPDHDRVIEDVEWTDVVLDDVHVPYLYIYKLSVSDLQGEAA